MVTGTIGRVLLAGGWILGLRAFRRARPEEGIDAVPRNRNRPGLADDFTSLLLKNVTNIVRNCPLNGSSRFSGRPKGSHLETKKCK